VPIKKKYTFRLQQQREKHFCKFRLQGFLYNYQSYPKIKIQIFFFDIETVINISFFMMGYIWKRKNLITLSILQNKLF